MINKYILIPTYPSFSQNVFFIFLKIWIARFWIHLYGRPFIIGAFESVASEQHFLHQ